MRALLRSEHERGTDFLRRGRFAVIPLSSGEDRSPQLHEFVVAMELVSPAVISYWSALNHHGMTEQLPRTVFVATDHPVRRQPGDVLGVAYRIISLKPEKMFGVLKDRIDETPFRVTDKEKTIIDGLDLPQYAGGVSEIAKAMKGFRKDLNETKLRDYAARIGNSAVAKRLGFIMETLGLGDCEALRAAIPLGSNQWGQVFYYKFFLLSHIFLGILPLWHAPSVSNTPAPFTMLPPAGMPSGRYSGTI